jgi:Plasmid pRiA4b ORF-3-like protein
VKDDVPRQHIVETVVREGQRVGINLAQAQSKAARGRFAASEVEAGRGTVQQDLSYPRYVAGERNVPPEDCGGIPGSYETLHAAVDPSQENHAEAKQWLDDYDPDTIDELPIKYALGRIANRRNAARARLAEKQAASSR